MTSAQDKSPDRPEGAPEAAGGDPKPLLDESGFSSGVSVRRRDALETTKKLDAAEAEVARLREALDKAAHALEITADFIAEDMGKESGTAQGIRYDAERARRALENSND